SRVRIAPAHEFGPCTSTPLRSAIPPRRIFSLSGTRLRGPRFGFSGAAIRKSLARRFGLARPSFRHAFVTLVSHTRAHFLVTLAAGRRTPGPAVGTPKSRRRPGQPHTVR